MNLLAETPENWSKARVGNFCDVQLGKMLQNDPSSERDELKPYLRAINVGKEGLDLSHEFSMWIRPQEADRFRLTKGDILVSEGGDAGRAAVFDADGEYYFQNAINRVRPNHHGKIEPEFIYYWFTFLKITGYVEMICNVATIPHFTAEKVKAAPLALPPLDTQRRIVRFLDEKTARIDGLIEKKRALLDRLAEKRQALITRAVTKGLNPDVPMKPSGIDWLGDIPANWEIVPLRWYLHTASGEGLRNVDIANDRTETDYAPVIGGNGTMGFTDATNSEKTILVIGRVGAHCGNVHPIEEPSWITDNALRVYDVRNFDRDYLLFALRIRDLNALASRNAQPLMTGETVKAQYLPCPLLSEQRSIGKDLKRTLGELENHEAHVGESIQLLSEYRSALITAAITGQLADLR